MRNEAQRNEAVAVSEVKDHADHSRHEGEVRRSTEVSRSTESREVRERREAEARDKDNGWFGVFLSWIPNMLLALVLVGLMFLGMFYIEHGTLNLGIETASPHAK